MYPHDGKAPRAIIAEDEPLLARHLQSRLESVWPELTVCGIAANGTEALAAVEREHPDVIFLDIKMPGLAGLEVAERLTAGPRVVFVTAYDYYAVEAFEHEAVDYLLKPVADDRLSITVQRLKARLREPAPGNDLARLIRQLREQLPEIGPETLRWIRAPSGEGVRIIAVEDVFYFQARDKYTSVFTAEGETVIRLTIKELGAALDPRHFWQIHRGTIVNVAEIASSSRDFRGALNLRLKHSDTVLRVSRAFSHLFKQM